MPRKTQAETVSPARRTARRSAMKERTTDRNETPAPRLSPSLSFFDALLTRRTLICASFCVLLMPKYLNHMFAHLCDTEECVLSEFRPSKVKSSFGSSSGLPAFGPISSKLSASHAAYSSIAHRILCTRFWEFQSELLISSSLSVKASCAREALLRKAV